MEENKKIFSVVIPVYNGEETIERVLNSIELQKEYIAEVIIANDRSTDKTIEIAKTYEETLPIICVDVPDDLEHGPGNARSVGMAAASSEWITFIDADDEFERRAFKQVYDWITENATENDIVLVTDFSSWDNNDNKPTNHFTKDTTWVHGKWYRLPYLKERNLTFAKNLFTHEDVYFNTLVTSVLIQEQKDFTYLTGIHTYKWILRKTSITRSLNSEKHIYVEVYLKDYLRAVTEPAIMAYKLYQNNEVHYRHQVIVGIMYAYFYFQSFLYNLGDDAMMENIEYIKAAVQQLEENFGFTRKDLIKYVYEDIPIFERIREKSKIGVRPYIEVISFRDFILSL